MTLFFIFSFLLFHLSDMSRMELCGICEQTIMSDHGAIHANGLQTILNISRDIGDGLADKLSEMSIPIAIHKQCRSRYTKPSSIKATKRKMQEDLENIGFSSRRVRRSEVPTYNPRTDCFYCTKTIPFFRNCTKEEPENYDHKYTRDVRNGHRAETKEVFCSALTKAKSRNDDWGNEVLYRLSPFEDNGDFVAEEVKYHHTCQLRFFRDKICVGPGSKGRPTGEVDRTKADAFAKLCEHLDAHEDGQFTVSQLLILVNRFSDGETYGPKTLRQKLLDHYGSGVIVTNEPGKESVYTFLDAGNKILRDNYHSSGMSKDDMIDMVATLISDDIRTQKYDSSKYPKFSDMSNTDIVPDSLLRLLHGVITSKASANNKVVERKRMAIAHSIIAAARPRSFISPILLAITVYINTRLESRELVDLLSSLSFADDYRELSRLHDSLMPTEQEISVALGDLANFVFDNADINVRSLTGLDTFHVMGGIVASAPHQDSSELDIHRNTNIRRAVELGHFGQIPIKAYRKPRGTGLKQVIVGSLGVPNRNLRILRLAKSLDNVWLASFSLLLPLQAKCPNWSGFMQVASPSGTYETSTIQILPFIDLDPTKPDTIYSALSFAQDQLETEVKRRVNSGLDIGSKKLVGFATFDQPLYCKADDIVEASPEIDRVIVRLGGFHLAMSYMGAVAFALRGSGIEPLWETVYAPKTVEHMLSGHAYARALRAHFLTAAAVTKLMLEEHSDCLTEADIQKLNDIHKLLLDKSSDTEAVLDDPVVSKLAQALDDLAAVVANQSRTGKLWVNYLYQIQNLRLFIYAERTGDWDLHLYCVSEMVPILHAAGHLPYARSTRRYLDKMKQIPDILTPNQLRNFTVDGYFTIRRTDRYWSGNFSDQTIEQVLMRMLKAQGGLAHGRGITPSTQAKLVHVLPKCVPICNALESFCNVHAQTSDQHTDLRAATTSRDASDFDIMFGWLKAHSPLGYQAIDGLVNISTGVVAQGSANADSAYEVGKAAADAMTGKSHGEVKLKRNDRVVTISAANNSVRVRGQDVEISSTLLFMRVTCLIKNEREMQGYLKYEFAKHPPSIFSNGMLRKNTKSDLANALKVGVTPMHIPPLRALYVVDGGHLLQTVVWPLHGTYGDVIAEYVAYVQNHFGTGTFIIFDGYGSRDSTKFAEQERRANVHVSAKIVFTAETRLSSKQRDFLNNHENKSRFIPLLMAKLSEAGMRCLQSSGDADHLIAFTAVAASLAENRPVVQVGNDTDLCTILVDQVTDANDMYMQFSSNPVTIYKIADLQNNLSPSAKTHILVGHAFLGCDTVSAMYNVGKKKALAVLSENHNWDCLHVFKQEDACHNDIASAGEQFMLKLYGAKTTESLDQYRYVMYLQKLSKKSLASASFQLESLPPTSAAAKFHAYRAYHTVQQWLGNDTLSATDWGWQIINGHLYPVETDQEPAPERVLRIVSCGCKMGCNKRCKCRKASFKCSQMCSHCLGHCRNGDDDDLTED